MVGLGSVDNTSDAAKPVSTAQQTALDLKAPLASPAFTGTVSGITAPMVGLSNVDNTSDVNKPVSTAQQAALNIKANLASPTFMGVPSAPTPTTGTNTTQLATTAFVRSEISNLVASAPAALDTLNELALAIGSDASFSTTISNQIGLKAPINNPTFTGTVNGITATMVGLSNVDNTSDANKPVSTAQQTALDLKANLASPTFTGTVGGISKAMVGLGNADNTSDANKPVSTAQQTALDLKAPLASPAFTGTVSGISKEMVGLALVDNTSDVNKPVSTAQQSALDLKAPLESPTFIGTVSGISKAMVELGDVDNTSDAAKPVSTAQQSALDLKANLASPTFTGTVTGITAAMVGLGNVNNTSDVNKPVSTAQQTALDLKANLASPAFTGTVTGITAAMVGLGNVNNTSDVNKPVSTAQQTALDLKANLASPAFTGTVTGISKAMVGLGSVDNTADAVKPVSAAQQTALDLKANLASPAFTGTVTGITKTMVGLGNVDNTSDVNKPVSTAQQTALDLKANLASPTFTGTVTGISKAMVGLGSVDNTADAVKPVSAAQQTALDLKANLSSPTFTGTVSGITAAMVGLGSVNNTADAVKPVSTAQQAALDLKANLASPTFTGVVNGPAVSIGGATVGTNVLSVNGDVSFNGNLSIGKDVTIIGRLAVQQYQQNAIINTTTTNYALIVSEDLSLNGRVYTSGDASLNGNVYAGKSLTVNGNININGNIVGPSTGTHSIGGTLTTTTSVTTTSSVLGNETVTGSETIAGGLFVTGGDASFNNRLFVLKDASMSGNVAVAGNLTVTGTVSFPVGSISAATISGGFPYVDLTTAQTVAGIKTFSSKLVAGADLSANARLSVASDASVGGNVAVAGNTTVTGSLTVTGPVSFPAGAISAATISGGFPYVDLTTAQTVAGVKTFSSKLIAGADLSANGNVSVAGNLNVTNITGYSTPTSTLDSWMLTNLINAPPAITFGTPTITSSYIYVPWSYPTQIQSGVLGYLPVISKLTIEYGTGSAGSRTLVGNLLANALAADYINDYTTNSNPNVLNSSTTPITGIIFAKANSAGILGTPASTKEAAMGTVITTTFGSDSGTRRALLFYDSNIASLNSSSNFYVNIYYKNNNTNNNVAYSYPTGYTLTGFPSAPRNVSQTASATNSMTIQYYDPSYGDALNPTNAATVNAYQLTYQSYNAAARYGGNVYVQSTTVSATAPSTTTVTPDGALVNNASKAILGLYPDASYSVTVQAQNTGNTTYGASSTVFYASTAALSVPVTSYNISGLFPTNIGSSTNNYSVASAATTPATVNNLIVESTATVKTTTSAFKAVVNDYSTRGTNGSITSRMYLTASVTGARTATGANVAFNTVYPIDAVPSAETFNNITITPTGVVDYYSAGATGGLVTGSDGFYQEATCNMTLGTGLLVPSSSQYTVTLSRSCTSGVTPTSSSYSFYYDNLTDNPGTPTINSFALATGTNAPSTTQICGVNVIWGTPTFDVSYSVTNMGNYFYKSPLVNYSSTSNSNTIISATETAIPSYGTNVTDGKLNPTVNFTNRIVSGGTSTTAFATSIPLTITANNINGSSPVANATAISAIIDYASYTLITSTLPTTVPTVSTSATIGSRVQAGANTGSELTTSNGFGTVYATASPLYDHAQSLLAANTTYGAELQIANGRFQTRSGATTAYLNYPAYSYPTNAGLNYTEISATGYRYATFVWKIVSPALNYTSVTFTINGSTGTVPTVSNFSTGFANGTKNIRLYYRTEDSGAAAVGSSVTSYWIDANSNAGTRVSANNASASDARPLYGLIATPTATQYSVLLPLRSWSSLAGTAYLYCKIGLPMDETYAFQSISASLGTASAVI
jgi:hypothetical protein